MIHNIEYKLSFFNIIELLKSIILLFKRKMNKLNDFFAFSIKKIKIKLLLGDMGFNFINHKKIHLLLSRCNYI